MLIQVLICQVGNWKKLTLVPAPSPPFRMLLQMWQFDCLSKLCNSYCGVVKHKGLLLGEGVMLGQVRNIIAPIEI
jgi:hypothetical protein